MARKKAKNKQSPAKEKPFNNPFAELGKELKKVAPAPEPPKAEPAPRPRDEDDDPAIFARAMAGARPLQGNSGRVPTGPANPQPNLAGEPNEDLEVLAHLADLVAGGGEFDLRYSDEYLEGHAPGVSAELVERLAAGEFPVQDYLDLHGLSEDQALAESEEFIKSSVGKGLRHTLVVHGKGAGSAGGKPVLKPALFEWLHKKSMRKWVLAFCTALPADGGTGAMYLLLRKHPGR